MSDEDIRFHAQGESGEVVVKIIVIGDGNVGKTSLLRKYVKKQFEHKYLPTVGVNISKQPLKHTTKDGRELDMNLMFWDIAGQPQFFLLHKVYYNGANAAILMFDLTQSHTFMNVKNWYNELVKYNLQDIPIILVGNKSDLKKEKKIIRPMAENMMDQLGIGVYFETSALNG
ncbi:MAG: GTP-binding protein, partial [Candidatus Lokiarchaeota archaeon]|nr:GTP-binding protein [Candidatus Lokiarchaeota archaeon]